MKTTLVIVFGILSVLLIVLFLAIGVTIWRNNPVTQMPNYNDYDKKPEFRVAFDSNQYYVEYKTWDMKNWARENTPFPTREDAQAVVGACEKECQHTYDKIIGKKSQPNKPTEPNNTNAAEPNQFIDFDWIQEPVGAISLNDFNNSVTDPFTFIIDGVEKQFTHKEFKTRLGYK